MAEITCSTGGKEKSMFAGIESYNPSGSIRDRVAEYMIDRDIFRANRKRY